jgi:hypothetical protein
VGQASGAHHGLADFRKSVRMVSILVPSKRSALSSTVRRAD